MSRTLKYDIPGDDPRVSVDDAAEKGWAGIFGASSASGTSGDEVPKRVLEIGFGRGEFLLAMAAAAPEVEFLGIEVSFKRTLKMARKVARAGHKRVRLIEAPGESAIQRIFEPRQLDAIWVNFSDPWPKVRHGHRRVVRPDFAANVARVLAPGGHLYVAT